MQDIFTIMDPTIELDVIDVRDNESKPENSTFSKNSQTFGDFSPYVRINGFDFFGNDILGFNLNLDGFFPVLTITIRERFGTFIMKGYPKDGDVISVYIKSNNKDYKSIRQDYRIVDVNGGNNRGDKYSEANTYTLKGILNLPEIFSDKLRSYNGMNSLDTLKSVCKELGLGLVTNETSFNDKMTRICPSVSFLEFITNDVSMNAYKDESSFFTVFIDQYYYLNFIEVNQLIVLDKELDETIINYISPSNYQYNDINAQDNVKQDKFYLTNSQRVQFTPNHITSYVPKNKSGAVHLNYGYKSNLLYYKKDKKEFKEFAIETLNTKGTEGTNFVNLKGRKDKNEKDKLKRTLFVGLNTENVFEQFQNAMFQNEINNIELEKFTLSIKMPTCNPILHKYQIIPVYIINSNSELRTEILENKGMSNEGKSDDSYDPQGTDFVNKFLSGFYICKGITYTYNNGMIETSANITKRDFFAKMKDEDQDSSPTQDSKPATQEIKKDEQTTQQNPFTPTTQKAKELAKDVQDKNVQAFLKVIRQAEGTDGPDGYRKLFGGDTFQSLADHPNIIVCKPSRGKKICSTAAGAYQILYGTWINVKGRLKLTDFSEKSQDLACVQLINGRGALTNVKNGEFEIAIQKCNREWASLPGSPYGQPTKSLAYLKQVYTGQGGVFA